jgi:hypothetical protein
MGEMYPPSAADYAAHNARDAQEKNKQLELRVAELEKRLKFLEKTVSNMQGIVYSGP